MIKLWELGEKDGDTVILIHGAADSYISFSQTASVLAKKVFHVYIPELRGHGNSDKPEGKLYTCGLLAEDIAEWMNKAGIKTALAGHSLGSMAAQNIAIAHPGSVSSLTLMLSRSIYQFLQLILQFCLYAANKFSQIA